MPSAAPARNLRSPTAELATLSHAHLPASASAAHVVGSQARAAATCGPTLRDRPARNRSAASTAATLLMVKELMSRRGLDCTRWRC
jgi:hypothetical protein